VFTNPSEEIKDAGLKLELLYAFVRHLLDDLHATRCE
jgi:hypothetical protein